MDLIVFNYSMNSKSVVFSHQSRVVIELSRVFDTIYVFTTEPGDEILPQNIQVSKIPWVKHRHILNLVTIVRKSFPFLLRHRKCIVFSHMTDVHSLVISPFTWILGMRHVLWYAHAKTSIYLYLSSFFVKKIVSSTSGSCNIKTNKDKVVLIGQGIDESLFEFSHRDEGSFNKLMYFGRLDDSKNIHLFPPFMRKIRQFNNSYSLSVFGSLTDVKSHSYINDIFSVIKSQELTDTINFLGALDRSKLSDTAKSYGPYLNLFNGSLDKGLIESTFMGNPVITWNKEYCREFGTWSNHEPNIDLDFLVLELLAFSNLPKKTRDMELLRRSNQARLNHNLPNWTTKLSSILKDEGS